ncbi:LysR family transcriptional regulator [Sphingobium algorifonticola]|uniref:LysR family transcriptional regulator n=1 Tax=Sphingobium algorifonticola TaxID=2008318 RepID=A0A437JD13_9SPHN|nr:LysR family transcriptional regulator [Sphingobium algorifonticola]RVT43809.1 LysR family transcriptional regulator [Sphingobium algorifonticola]
MNLLLSWDLLSSFIAVAQTGSLSAAARCQRRAQPTVRRHIEALEAQLGVMLFTRSQSGLVPTQEALRIIPYVESMASTAQALVRTASGEGINAGTVRIAASELMAAQVLPAILSRMFEASPALAIELVASDLNEDLLRRDADIAVRMNRPTQAALVARRVGTASLGLYASKVYLARFGEPDTLAELVAQHRLIGEDRGTRIIDAFRVLGVAEAALNFALRSDNDNVQLAAMDAGIGIGVCQIALAKSLPGLRRVLPDITAPLEIWVVAHEDLRNVPRVRLTLETLAKGLASYLKSELSFQPLE